jgi:hypothetical protein
METIYISIFFITIISGIIVLRRISRKNREKMIKEIEDGQL